MAGPRRKKGALTPTASSRLFLYRTTWLRISHAYDGSLGTHLEPKQHEKQASLNEGLRKGFHGPRHFQRLYLGRPGYALIPGPKDETIKGPIQGTPGRPAWDHQEGHLSRDTRGGQHCIIQKRKGGLSGPLEDQAWRGDTPLVLGQRPNLQVLLHVWGVGGTGRARQDLREDLA